MSNHQDVDIRFDGRQLQDIVSELKDMNKNLSSISKTLDNISTEQKKDNSFSSGNTMKFKIIESIEKLVEAMKNNIKNK